MYVSSHSPCRQFVITKQVQLQVEFRSNAIEGEYESTKQELRTCKSEVCPWQTESEGADAIN